MRTLGFLLALWAGADLSAAERFRTTPLKVERSSRVGFTAMAASRTGVEFVNRLPEGRGLTNHVLLNGSGVALADVDGDGRCDVFLAGLGGGSALYRNLGDWRFEEITRTSFPLLSGGHGIWEGLDATGAVFADLDGDGAVDLLVNTVGRGTHCFRNDGHGVFREVTDTSGLASGSGGTSFAVADVDGDGDLDVYVVNYRSATVRDAFQQRFEVRMVAGKPVVATVNGRPTTDPDLIGRFVVDEAGRVTERGEADVLYLNDGRGRFDPLAFTAGAFLDERGRPLLEPPYDWGLSAMFRDIDGDGHPDLYVCNDLNSWDRIWMNDGKGRFRAMARDRIRKTSWFSMGIDFGDLNRDGRDDFVVMDMLPRDRVRRHVDMQSIESPSDGFVGAEARPQTPRNTLYAGRGDGTFAEIAWAAGMTATDWSWSPVLLDVDLDGYEDLLVTTGFERDVQDGDVAEEIEAVRRREKLGDAAAIALRRRFPSLAQANLAYWNRGAFVFEEVGKRWGFDQVGISQGMAWADLDGDGDLDGVINNENAPALLLRNDGDAPRVAVRLHGRGGNPQGVGARLEVTGGPVVQKQEVIAGGRYLSGDDAMRVFAAGNKTNRLTVRVRWRNGRETRCEGIEPDRLLEVWEPEDGPVLAPAKSGSGLFEDVSSRLGHRHVEQPFDDFQRQPAIPRRYSHLGPAVCWADLNGDGSDDLVVGSGRGGKLGVFLNDGRGGFSPGRHAVYQRPAILDHAGILVRAMGGQAPVMLVGFSSYEADQGGSGIRMMDLATDGIRRGGPTLEAAMGPLAMGDVDGDGVLDLFVGGRVMPGRYPEAPPSLLYRGTNGGFELDSVRSRVLAGMGMVTSAMFSDVDGDGWPDLVVTTEWGSLHWFGNARGKLIERDMPIRGEVPPGVKRLSELTGWWNGVTSVDLDGDGRLDWVASNWGRNTRYQGAERGGVAMDWGDLESNGGVQVIELETVGGVDHPMAHRDRLTQLLPTLQDRYPTRRAYAMATADEVLGTRRTRATRRTVTTLDSVVLLNRGDHFWVKPLPAEAQWAPAFAVVASDFNGDGKEDVFLGQNHWGGRPEMEREDSGEGLLLLGDGKGGLRAVDGGESGIRISGEQRGAAVADFDGDGRMDLVVTQNGGETRLLRNAGGVPGVRIRLEGPATNPTGIGVRLRGVGVDGRLGPVREIRGGGGYWAQDSAVTVLAMEGGLTGIQVQWPGKVERRVPAVGGKGMIRIGVE